MLASKSTRSEVEFARVYATRPSAHLMTRSENAGRKTFDILMRLVSGFGEVGGFRATLEVVKKDAEDRVRAQVEANLPLLLNALPAAIFANGGRYAGSNGRSALVDDMAKGQLQHAWTLRDKASLILAHTALDACVTDLLRAAAAAEPRLFEEKLAKRKVGLREAMSLAPEALLDQALESFLTEAERGSIVSRIKLLLAILKPEPTWLNAEGWRYDEAEISRIDSVRHALVHGPAPSVDALLLDADIKYLETAGLRLWAILVTKLKLHKGLALAAGSQA